MARSKKTAENEIIEDFEKGLFQSTRHAKKEIKIAKHAAENYLRKNNRINIRLSSTDLNLIKRRAVQEGIPYQTLISSVLHKFVTGSL